MRIPTWLRSNVFFALLLALFAACGVETTGSPELILAEADAAIDEEEEHTCPIHPPEESGDDGCCGCHYWGSPHECLSESECAEPVPEPCEDTAGPVGAVFCAVLEPSVTVLEHANTYYRIGGGVEPRNDEYEYVMGQSGAEGKIRKGGGDGKVGVSVYSTEADAMAARMRIGSTGKIHKISSFPKDLEFISSQPPPNHFHIVPAREMKLSEFKAALKKVKLTKVEP